MEFDEALESLLRKAEDPGIPAAEQRAFRAKADEVRRRMNQVRPVYTYRDDFSDSSGDDRAQEKAWTDPEPSARAKPSARSKPAPPTRPARRPVLPLRRWLATRAAAATMVLAASLLFQYAPGLLVVALLLFLGAGVLWSDRRGI